MAIINLSDVNVDSIIDIAIKAGFAILEEYDALAPQYDTKADKSPLTRADLRAHTIIKNGTGENLSGNTCIIGRRERNSV